MDKITTGCPESIHLFMGEEAPQKSPELSYITIRRKNRTQSKNSSSIEDLCSTYQNSCVTQESDSSMFRENDISEDHFMSPCQSAENIANSSLIKSTSEASLQEMRQTITELRSELNHIQNLFKNTVNENKDLHTQNKKLMTEMNFIKSLNLPPVENKKNANSNRTEGRRVSLPCLTEFSEHRVSPISTTLDSNKTIILRLEESIGRLQQQLQSANEDIIKMKGKIKSITNHIQPAMASGILEHNLKLQNDEEGAKIWICGTQQCVGLASAILRSRYSTTYEKYSVRGLLSKKEIFELTLQELHEMHNEPDIICLSETFIKQGYENYLKIHGYVNSASFCRDQQRGGSQSVPTFRNEMLVIPIVVARHEFR
ncbi:unnamed protein product [Colias eurytheme]|nr:unnamed protein product [Colias eurytheme]